MTRNGRTLALLFLSAALGSAVPAAHAQEAQAPTPAPQAAQHDEAAAGPALAAGPEQVAEKLSPMVEDVQVVGPWTNGGESGVWRTVMMKSPAGENRYHFFVQQLTGTDAELTLKASTEIAEINTVDGSIVGYRADEPSQEAPSGLTLFFDVLPSGAEIAETYEMHFFPDAPYDFGPATN